MEEVQPAKRSGKILCIRGSVSDGGEGTVSGGKRGCVKRLSLQHKAYRCGTKPTICDIKFPACDTELIAYKITLQSCYTKPTA